MLFFRKDRAYKTLEKQGKDKNYEIRRNLKLIHARIKKKKKKI